MCRNDEWEWELIYRVAVHNPTEDIITAASDGYLILWNVDGKSQTSVYEKGYMLAYAIHL